MAYPGVSQQDPSRWSSSDRHQPTTAAPVPVAVGAPISNTPQESCYYTQSQADVSPPPITACEPQGVLDLSIDPGTYIAYSAGYYSQDQYTAQQRLPAQQQSAREVHAYSRSQQARRPSYPGLPSTTNPIVLTQRQAVQQLQRQQQQQQPQQTSPSTPGMYSSSSTSSPTTSVASFEGNILFWTTNDLRDTAVWGDESLSGLYSSLTQNSPFSPAEVKRHVEYKITTPKGYATQTRTSIEILQGAPIGGSSSMEGSGPYGSSGVEGKLVAEFVWASPTQLGMCRFRNGLEIPMVHFLQDGTNRDCTRFFVRDENNTRCFEWYRDANQTEVFNLFDVANQRMCAKYVGGPFGSRKLYPYMQYFWVEDDSLLLFSVLAITIRRWSDKYT